MPKRDKWWQYKVALALAKAEADLTYDDIGAALGTSERTVRRYFASPGRMALDTMQRLHRVLGLDAATVRDTLPVT